jgi:enoyl-CoA hydratase/carnithine racemase
MFVTTDLAENGVLTVTLARPEKRNAMNDPFYEELVAIFDDAATDSAVRCVLLTAQGPDFCAGNDIGDFEDMNDGTQDAAEGPGDVIIHRLVDFEKPVVAAVRGRTVGFGTTMLLHTDLLFLAPDVRMRAPFVTLGLTPEAASSALLPRLLGHQRSFAMFALGEPMLAQEAVDLGFAYKVVESDELESAARAAADRLADLSQAALTRTKRLMRASGTLRAQVDLETDAFYEVLVTPEAGEAFAAFRDRRDPDFRAVTAQG